MVIALLTPFAAFWVPESLGGSGVLATVAAGLYVSWNGPRFISPATRLQGFFVWDLVVYGIEGVIFLLTGLQARVVADTLDIAQWEYLAIASASVCVTIIAVRFVWVFVATYLPRWLWPGLARSGARPHLAGNLPGRLHRHQGRGVAGGGAVDPPDGERHAVSRPRPAAAGHLQRDLRDPGGTGTELFPGSSRSWGWWRRGGARRARPKAGKCAPVIRSIDAALGRLDALEGRRPNRRQWRRCGGGIRIAGPISSPPVKTYRKAMPRFQPRALQLRFLRSGTGKHRRHLLQGGDR